MIRNYWGNEEKQEDGMKKWMVREGLLQEAAFLLRPKIIRKLGQVQGANGTE